MYCVVKYDNYSKDYTFEIKSNVGPLDILMQTNGNIQQNKNSKLISNGGLIRLQAFKKANKLKKLPEHQIDLFGLMNASSNTLGGKIIIESDAINMHKTCELYANGWNGGGTILIGGDWQGGSKPEMRENEDIYEAISVNMEKGALIDASAKYNGNGGKVVIWSNTDHPKSNTVVKGALKALGGKYTGKGGMIETSGGAVDFEKVRVSTIASDGSAGKWLIDPWNFYFNSNQLNTLASNLNNNNVTISTWSSGPFEASVCGDGHVVFLAQV
jgi:hypothetical protein